MRDLLLWTVLILLPAGLLAQEAPARRALAPVDMFRLDYFLRQGAEHPVAWLDAARYLVFDAGGEDRAASWVAVAAASGEREVWVDVEQVLLGIVEAGLAVDGIESVREELGDEDRWIWSEDHRAFVLNVARDLWSGGLGMGIQRLTSTPAEEEDIVQIAPGGKRVAFVREHNLHTVSFEGGEEVAITTEGHADRFFGKLDWVYQEEVYGRGDFRATWWSPDGEHLAFLDLDESPVLEFTLVSDVPARPEVEVTNYPKTGEPNPRVWLCTAPAGGGDIVRCDLSVYPVDDRLLVRVTWTPDSREIFCQVQNREQTWLDMLAFDPRTGTGRKVFHEPSDCWVEPGPEPLWIGDSGEFLWLSERSGYKHLYHYDRDGTERGALTQGEWQVLDVCGVDAEGGHVWALCDKASPIQRHLYRIPLAGGMPQQVTSGRGTWDVTMSPDFAHFFGEWSSAEHPPKSTVYREDGSAVRAVFSPPIPLLQQFGLVKPEFLQIPTRGGFDMEAMVLRPADFDPKGSYPVVQHTYSGPHAPRVRDRWMGRDWFWHQLLVQNGYVVFVCDNRSASGKGRRFARSCWRDMGTSELNDLSDGLRWLIDQGGVDADRTGLWGWSYGGYQTLFNMCSSTLWKCGVAVNPVTDWRLYDTIYTERYMGLPDDNQQGYERASVMTKAAGLNGDLMLVAAAMDDNVHMQNSLQFLHALQMAGKDCDFMVYPRVRHGIGTLPQQLHLFSRMKRFFDEHLGGGAGR
jgi:dipeptidyl-peptidase-4